MSSFEDYANKYQTARMERRDGILQITLHTEGQSLRWGFLPHGELPEAFHDIGADRENRVVILTGTGAEFSGPRATPGTSSFPSRPSIERIDRIHWEGRHLLMNLLNIEVPVISAINGPAWRHSEIPLLCDIVLAADTAAPILSGPAVMMFTAALAVMGAARVTPALLVSSISNVVGGLAGVSASFVKVAAVTE